MTHGNAGRGRRLLLGALTLATTLALAGCDSAETRRMRAGDTSPGPALQVELCRKLSKKGKRQDVGHEFTMGDKSSVLAFADFTDLVPGRDYTVHLVWVRPDGRELFRRFAEFSLAGRDQDWTANVAWKDALDLDDSKREVLKSETPSVTLDSNLNTSPDKKRETGTWHFRVYLDRRLVRDEAFTLAEFQEVPTGVKEDGDDKDDKADKADKGSKSGKSGKSGKSAKRAKARDKAPETAPSDG